MAGLRITLIIALVSSTVFAQQVDRSFNEWDKNKDGRLVRDELPQRIRGNFDRVDRDKDGFISLKEHLAVMARARKSRQPRVPAGVTMMRDIAYAGTDNPRQKLDLVLPKKRATEKPLPVIVFIHGGGWRNGDKRSGIGRVAGFVATGQYAGASIGYRLTDEAQWPAQIHDCKAAIRFLKGNAKKYNIDPDRIAVWGTSAGGHLVAMLGVSGGVKELEGTLGSHNKQNSSVAAAIDFFGPAELLTMNAKAGKIDHDSPDSPESKLIGGAIQQNKDKARNASPLTWVSKDDAPILIMHGTDDPLVIYPQSVAFHAAFRKVGVDSTLITVQGAGHGFGGAEVDRCVRTFLENQLLDHRARLKDQTIESTRR